MKRATIVLFALLALVCCASFYTPGALAEQVIELESVYARLSFPDPWLVLTPASLPVYAGILREAGLDPEAMETRFAADNVVAEGWSETFEESYRLLVREDERSQTIFDIARSTGPQRKAIAASFTDAKARGQASVRYHEAEWDKRGELGWVLLLRYNVMNGEAVSARGLQYFTIRNGKSYVLDWVLGERRATNRDLARFREMLEGLSFEGGEEAPMAPAKLEVEGGMPTETGSAELRLEGKTEPDAGLLLARDVGTEQPEMISVGSANRKGDFTLIVTLPEQGDYNLILTAVKDGYQDAVLSGTLTYKLGLLPIHIENQPGAQYTQDSYPLTGTAPSGTEIQIVTGDRSVQRKVGTDGRFSAEIDTRATGDYSILLTANRKGYHERRIVIEFTRVRTEQQDLQELKSDVKAATYAQLLRDPEAYVGELLSFTGEVEQISHGEETQVWFVRLNVARGRNDHWPMVLVCDSDPRLEEGLRITFYAWANSPFAEQDAQGNEIAVPSLTLAWVEE